MIVILVDLYSKAGSTQENELLQLFKHAGYYYKATCLCSIFGLPCQKGEAKVK